VLELIESGGETAKLMKETVVTSSRVAIAVHVLSLAQSRSPTLRLSALCARKAVQIQARAYGKSAEDYSGQIILIVEPQDQP